MGGGLEQAGFGEARRVQNSPAPRSLKVFLSSVPRAGQLAVPTLTTLRAAGLVCLRSCKQTNQKAAEARGWQRFLTPAPSPGLEIGPKEVFLGPDGPRLLEIFYNAAVNFLNCVPVLGLCLIAAR